jgi:four helix bundle protein
MYNYLKQEKVFDIKKRSFIYGVEIVKFVKNLPRDNSLFTLSNQLIRSGTSIGANIEESQNCGSKKEFIHTLTVSLKEARETEYWLRIINEVKLADQGLINSLLQEVNELIRILTTIVKKAKMKP